MLNQPRTSAPRSSRLLAFLAMALGLIVTVAATSTTTASAATFAYDVPAIVRVDIRGFEAVGASPTQVSVAREGSSSSAVEARGPSATLSITATATEAVPRLRHYTTSGAAESIIKGGEITPGSSGNIWVTPDRYVDSATAQSRLALGRTPDGYFEIPLCRVSCPSPASTVQPWGGFPGGGIEITTTSPIDITGLSFKTFGPR